MGPISDSGLFWVKFQILRILETINIKMIFSGLYLKKRSFEVTKGHDWLEITNLPILVVHRISLTSLDIRRQTSPHDFQNSSKIIISHRFRVIKV